MDNALENVIQYVQSDTQSVMSNYNIITNLSYDGTEEDFKNLTDSFRSDINIKNLFKNVDNTYYQICDEIAENYDRLLIGGLDILLLVTRNDSVISIEKNSFEMEDNSNNIGIIKIDSVLSEMFLLSDIKEERKRWLKYSLCLFAYGVLVGAYICNHKFLANYVSKSD